jgi:hypothetical protein
MSELTPRQLRKHLTGSRLKIEPFWKLWERNISCLCREIRDVTGLWIKIQSEMSEFWDRLHSIFIIRMIHESFTMSLIYYVTTKFTKYGSLALTSTNPSTVTTVSLKFIVYVFKVTVKCRSIRPLRKVTSVCNIKRKKSWIRVSYYVIIDCIL